MDTNDTAEVNEEWARNLAYRMAYGAAWRILERDRHGNFAKGDPAKALARLRAEVAREMGDDPRRAEAVDEGITDARAGRQPRW
jgi:hypothetical protein